MGQAKVPCNRHAQKACVNGCQIVMSEELDNLVVALPKEVNSMLG